MPRVRSFVFVLFLCAFLPLRYANARSAPLSLVQTDKAYKEKSYAAALQGYQNAIKGGTVPANRRDEIAFRIAVSLGKTHQWNSALKTSLDFVKIHKGMVWEPRGLYWLGRLYLALPDRAYRVGSQIQYGENVPGVDGSSAPQPVNMGALNALNARDALEAARVRFPAYRRKAHTEAEEVQLDFDLAQVLQLTPDYRWAYKQRWTAPNSPFWNVDPAAVYQPKWPYPKKLVYLYTQIGQIAPTSHLAALGLFGEASWLHLYHSQVQMFAHKWQRKHWIVVPYPYQSLHEADLLHTLVRRYPQDSARDTAQFTFALWREQENQFADALAEYRDLVAAHPNGRWRKSAQAHIQDIIQASLSVDTMPQTTDKPAHFTLTYRNTKRVVCRAYRVHPETVLRNAKHRADPNHEWDSFEAIFGPSKTLPGHPVAQWTVTTKDTGNHLPGTQQVAVPFRVPGAYVIEVRTPGARAVTGLFLSDLVIVLKVHRDGCLLYAANLQTGKPAASASILAKLWWNEKDKNRASLFAGHTAADGTLNIPFRHDQDRSQFNVTVLAYTSGHYAITEKVYGNESNDNGGKFRSYSITDRAVYRPAQTVHFHELALQRQSGSWMPVANQSVTVEVLDAKGNSCYKETTLTDAFGGVSGQVALAEGAPLGEYSINVAIQGETTAAQNQGGNRFRVEEYKKPEFAVTVVPEAGRVRLGQSTVMRVHAAYYFGGPVANAKVSYRVYRTPYATSYRFPEPYDFLYGYDSSGDYDTGYRNRAVVTQGAARTDARGDARVTFVTGPDPQLLAQAKQMAARGDKGYLAYVEAQDCRFVVEADVQDASRRVISGVGDVKATHHDVAVFLNNPQGYATKGDHIEIEVHTEDMSEHPVSVAGMAQVYRAAETPGGKETQIYQEPLHTDAQGRAYIHWTARTAGSFRVAYVTHDTSGQAVSTAMQLWVDGPELTHGRFLAQNVSLIARDRYCTVGKVAEVLLVTAKPGCSVLLTREADNEILDRRVIYVPGRSLELNIPVTQRDVPNVYLKVVLVRDKQIYRADTELFVPPAQQFASVTVQADRARYQPGEIATFRLQARDWQGHPLRTELSLSVSDAALSYIQKDYAEDIRTYFYGDRRSDSIFPRDSQSRTFPGVNEQFPPVPDSETVMPMLPDGMGQLQDWPGESNGFYRSFGVLDQNAHILYREDPSLQMPEAGELQRRTRNLSSFMGETGRVATMSPQSAKMAMRGSGGIGGAGEGDRFSLPSLLSSVTTEFNGNIEPVSVRSKFVDTAFWTPAIVTDAQGEATVQVTWPDNLTEWRASAVGSTTTAQVGFGDAHIAVKKDLLVRLQTPRFLVERDQVVFSANVHNYLPDAAHVKVGLELGGDNVELVPKGSPELGQGTSDTWIDLPAESEKRVDWTLHVRREGAVRVRVTAQSEAASDAMKLTLPVLVHGVERSIAQSGVLKEQNSATIPILLPEQRKVGSSELVVHLEPSLGGILLDALPYLADYPYGCTEQTVSRFLPSVLVAKTMQEAGLNLEDLRQRAHRLQEQATQAGSQNVPHSPYTYPQGAPGVLQIQNLASSLGRTDNPVFDKARLDQMVTDGLTRLVRFQHSDGGWGWWPEDGSDPYMSSYALYGLQLANEADYRVDPALIQRGLDYLLKQFLKAGNADDDLPLLAYEARALAVAPAMRERIRTVVLGKLFTHRERLNPYAKALLALTLHDMGDSARAELVLRNVETTVQIDTANGIAHWDDPQNFWWRWYSNKIETNSTLLQAYLAIAPQSTLPPMLAKWLVNNRQGAVWNSTRETALAVYALCAYSKSTGEFRPNYTLNLDLGGRIQRQYTVTPENMLFFDNTFVVPDALLQSGTQTLTLTRNGTGTCYYSATTRYFSEEEPIPAAGNEIRVQRRYFRLLPNTASGMPEEPLLNLDRPNPFLTGRYALLTTGGIETESVSTDEGPAYRRVALHSGDTLTSGDLVEVELQLQSNNDYDYLVFEDIKPSGCEPVELRSGGHAGLGVYSNMELRDQKVAFFLSSLPQGTRLLSYRLRAETPGAFHVLPTNGYAMYAPGIRALSEEMRLNIQDGD